MIYFFKKFTIRFFHSSIVPVLVCRQLTFHFYFIHLRRADLRHTGIYETWVNEHHETDR